MNTNNLEQATDNAPEWAQAIVTSGNLDKIPERKSSHLGTTRVSVTSHHVYGEMWNNLAAITNDRILNFKPQAPGWYVYLNPGYTVQSSEFSLEFTQEARRCQRAWIRAMSRSMGNRNRSHFARKADLLTRQLAHSGMLIVNGNVLQKHDWAAMEKELQFAGTGQLTYAASFLVARKTEQSEQIAD